MLEPELNSTETWIAEHSIHIFLVIAALILVGGFFVVKAVVQTGETRHEVDVLKPQVTRIYAAAAACAPRTIAKKGGQERCSRLLTVALRHCRQVSTCRAAFLAILTYPPPARTPSTKPSSTPAPNMEGGDAFQPSNHGHQPPGPGKGPHGGNQAPPAPTPPPAPSPLPPAPPAHEHGPPAETPGNGVPGGPHGLLPSGPHVEVCALEHTCIAVHLGD